IYEHGRFAAHDTIRTAAALRAYSLGLVGYAAIKVLTPCFYALDRPRTPLRVSLIGIGLNLTLNFLLVKGLRLGHVGLAATTACVATINFLQLAVALRRHVNLGEFGRWGWLILRVAAGAAACGIAAGIVVRIVTGASPSFVERLLGITAGTGAGVLAFFIVTVITRVPECAEFWRIAKEVARLAKI
ncbi:MAG: lipid II flippase MurJ, partial [Kiritimatiellia bacterium]